MNTKNYCIPHRQRILDLTTKQPLSNSKPQKPWKYEQLWRLRPDPSCLYKKVFWKRLQHSCFQVNYAELLGALFLLNTPEQMLLTLYSTNKIKVNRQKLFFYLPFFQWKKKEKKKIKGRSWVVLRLEKPSNLHHKESTSFAELHLSSC